jgi:hypothetical protein
MRWECADFTLEKFKTTFGTNNVGYASTLNNRGLIAKDLGKLDETISYDEQSSDIYKELKTAHQEQFAGTVVAFQNLGNALRELAKTKSKEEQQALLLRAKDLFIKASELILKAEGPNMRYAEAMRRLGNLCKDQLEYQQGRSV